MSNISKTENIILLVGISILLLVTDIFSGITQFAMILMIIALLLNLRKINDTSDQDSVDHTEK